jgi:hypothetical protein
MDRLNFPIEFNNEIDDVKKSDNEIYTLAVDRLSKLAEGHNDISGGVVNLKQPAQKDIRHRIYTKQQLLSIWDQIILQLPKKVSNFNPHWMAL